MQRSAPSAGSARSQAPNARAQGRTAPRGGDDAMGEAGRLGFAYSTAEGRVPATTPLAVGARASLVLRSEPGLAFGAIISAASLDPDTLAVVQTEPTFVIVEALAPGVTGVEVTAIVGEDGERVRDTLTIETREAERVSIARACATSDGGPFLADSRIALPFEMTGEDGAALTGWGFYPVEVAPPGAVEIDPEASATIHLPLRTTGYLGQVDLSSSLGGEPLSLDVVSEGEIEGAFLEGGERANEVVAGGSRDVRVVPIVRERPLCQGEPGREVQVLTPEVCTIGQAAQRGSIDPSTLVRVEGLARGACQIAVRYPRAADGQGIGFTFTLEVI